MPRERMHMPDATVYDPKDTFTKNKSASFGFGTGKRDSIDNNKSQSPGPGEYNYSKTNGYKFAMGIKPKEQGKYNNPGPGAYDQNSFGHRKTMPAFS